MSTDQGISPDLAQLLDGPVAERWGRPRLGRNFFLFRRVSDWAWADSEIDAKCVTYRPNEEAEAIWLAHLLHRCGELGWEVGMDRELGGWRVLIRVSDKFSPAGGLSGSLLLSLASAMLASAAVRPPSA